MQDAWAGLPELTNKGGEYCRDSVSLTSTLPCGLASKSFSQCETQAWSASTILDALEDVYKLVKS